MTFKEVLAQAIDWLQQDKRISYRGLKRQFDLDDEYLEDLKDALLYSHPVIDDEGKGLIWTGEAETKLEAASTEPAQQEDSLQTIPLKPSLPSIKPLQ